MAIDRMRDRCKRICSPNNKHCFINHKEQINCIADMVINKTTAVSMLLGMSLGETDPQKLTENLSDSITSVNELSNWIQYLQLVPDLQEVSSLILNSTLSEKRKEIRYPVPEKFRNRISLSVNAGEGQLTSDLHDFSQSGLRFTSPGRIEAGTIIEATLTGKSGDNPSGFRAKVRYSVKENGNYANGAMIQEPNDRSQSNFFVHVFRHLHNPIR